MGQHLRSLVQAISSRHQDRIINPQTIIVRRASAMRSGMYRIDSCAEVQVHWHDWQPSGSNLAPGEIREPTFLPNLMERCFGEELDMAAIPEHSMMMIPTICKR